MDDTAIDMATANTESDSSESFEYLSIDGEAIDLADISADLLEDPELSPEDDNSLASKNPDKDTLAAEPTPEPTTAFGTLLALGGLSLLTKLKHRKTKE